MDEKHLEKDVTKDGKGKDIIYEVDNSDKNPMVVEEARRAYTAERIYTYDDFLNWPEDERIEIIDGKLYHMPTPSEKHQALSMNLSLRFGNYLHGKRCRVYAAPFGVKLDYTTVVIPDLVVICDLEKLDERGLDGAADLLIEILSKSTAKKDRIIKYNKYLQEGVKEYWIIDPFKEEVTVNLLRRDRYIAKTYRKRDIIKVNVLDNLSINVTDLFEGSKGAEIVEVVTARQEERIVASEAMKAEKLEIAKKLLIAQLPINQITEITGLNFEMIQELVESKKHC